MRMTANKITIAQGIAASQIIISMFGETFDSELPEHDVLLLLLLGSGDSPLFGLTDDEFWGDMVRGSLWPKIR